MTQEYSCSLLKASNYLYIHQNKIKWNNKKGLLQTAAVLHTEGSDVAKGAWVQTGAVQRELKGEAGRKQEELSPSPGNEALTANRRNIKGPTTQGKKP